MTRPCKSGLDKRPERLFGFQLEPMDGDPCSVTGSITQGGVGLPSTGSLAGASQASN